jgi:hypothetical protein
MNVEACLSKHRYPTEQVAERKKNSIWFERRVALRAYACTECGGWHLTKSGAVAPVSRRFGPPKRPQRELKARERERRRRR